MKVYFTASILGKEKYEKEYRLIIDTLREMGIRVYSLVFETLEEESEIHRQRAKMLKGADLVVAEVSYPSLAVGYEISAALEAGKPLLALRLKGINPPALESLPSEKFKSLEYDRETLPKVLGDWLKATSESADVRFNFFVPPKIVNFLDWVSKEKRIPRSVYLRNLIEKEMAKNSEYKEEK